MLTSFDVNISFILSASQIKKVIPHYDLSEDVDLALDPSLTKSLTLKQLVVEQIIA